MIPFYSIQIDGQKEELFDDVELFDMRAHIIIQNKENKKSFVIRDYVMNEDWPTQVVFKRLENSKFDIKILKD